MSATTKSTTRAKAKPKPKPRSRSRSSSASVPRPTARGRAPRSANGAPPRPTVAERAAAGKASRAEAGRSRHAKWAPAADRPDPVVLLEEQATSRVPELVPIRYGRMAASPFAFFRGAAYVMAWDLARTPTSGIRVQLCGDAHLSNFGGFASPERSLVFDLNDFDETLPGPWEWDVKRLAASIDVACRGRGFSRAVRRRCVRAAVREYREAMRRFAEMNALDVWYARVSAAELRERFAGALGAAQSKRLDKTVAKALSKDSSRAFAKLAHSVDGEARIVADPPLIEPLESFLPRAAAEELDDAMRSLVTGYTETLPHDRRRLIEQYRYCHAARKVVGVGSVGTRAWVILMLGRDTGDPLFLQAKEAQRSVLAPFAGESTFANQGQRVVEGQRLMQAASDVALGWLHVSGIDGRPRDFYIRQLWDWKTSADIERMPPKTMGVYARLCGWTLARAHARSGDPVAIAGYLGSSGSFDSALADFAEAYGDQNERDHQALVRAIAGGRITARAEI